MNDNAPEELEDQETEAPRPPTAPVSHGVLEQVEDPCTAAMIAIAAEPIVSDEMISAGVAVFDEIHQSAPGFYLVKLIYIAMERTRCAAKLGSAQPVSVDLFQRQLARLWLAIGFDDMGHGKDPSDVADLLREILEGSTPAVVLQDFLLEVEHCGHSVDDLLSNSQKVSHLPSFGRLEEWTPDDGIWKAVADAPHDVGQVVAG